MARSARAARRRTMTNAVVTTLALVAGLVLINVAIAPVTARIDLSGAGLTPASRQLVAGLDEPLQITAYFGNVPTANSYEQEYVESLLERYAAASDGQLQWRVIDPFERGVEFQRQLHADEGIEKLMWISMVDDTPQQVPVYFQVVFSYLDQSETWEPPGRFDLTGLEYRFSSIIKRLAYPKKTVGVTRGFGSPERSAGIEAILGANYEVVPIDLAAADSDPSAVDVLIVNGPTQPVAPTAIAALDSRVLAGKPSLFLVRGMSFSGPRAAPSAPQLPNQPYVGMPAQTALDPLLAHYGVKLHQGVVLDQKSSVAGAVMVGASGILVKELFPLARAEATGDGEPLQGLSLIPLAFAVPVDLIDDFDAATGGEVTATALARSSPSSYARTSVIAITNDVDLSAKPTDRPGPFELGYALEGTFSSHLAAADDGDEPAASSRAATTSPAHTRMIVLGSADFASDAVLAMAQRHPLFRDLRGGALVLQNAVDWLANDQALTAARTKGARPPIDPLDASARWWVKWGNTVGSALLVLLAGLVAWLVRERRRARVTL